MSWVDKLPLTQTSQQVDHLSRALLKVALNSTSPQIQLSIRTLRHKLALTQPSTDVDNVTKSTFQALRSYYSATKSDKEAYAVCKETISPMLDQMLLSKECSKIINFIGVLARKAGLLLEAMRWNDLGLRKGSTEDKVSNALFLLRNTGILFSLPAEELGKFPKNLI